MDTTTCTHSLTNLFSVVSNNVQSCLPSVNFLQEIFGQPIYVLTGQAQITDPVSSLLTLMIGHFNAGMLAVIILVYAYIVYFGVLGAANEGKFGGREMSHFSYPIRVIIPPVLLAPISGGFCMLQFIMMYFILVGVNLANYVWQETLGDVSFGYVPTTPQAVNNAIIQNLASDFVTYTVLNIATHNNYAGKNLPVGAMSIWDTPYGDPLFKQLTSICGTNYTGDIQTLCQTNLQTMQKYKLGSIFAPLATYAGTSLIQTVSTPSMFIKIGPEDGSGVVNLGGTYTISCPSGETYSKSTKTCGVSKTAPTPPALLTCTKNILNGASTCTGSGSGGPVPTASAYRPSPAATATQPAGPKAAIPLDCNTDTTACSLDGALLVIRKALIQNENKGKTQSDCDSGAPDCQNLGNTAVGTGETCPYTCRTPYTGAYSTLYPNGAFAALTDKVDPVANPKASNRCKAPEIWTQQCYQATGKYDVTGTGKEIYAAITAQSITDSWWWGSRVYLQLNKAMATNINKLAKQVEQMRSDNSSLVTYTAPSGSKVDIPYQLWPLYLTSINSNHTFRGTGDLPDGKYWNPMVAFPYSIRYMSNHVLGDEDKQYPYHKLGNTPAVTIGDKPFVLSGTADTSKAMDTISYQKLASWYAPLKPQNTTPISYLQQAMGTEEAKAVTIGQANVKVTYVPSEFPQGLEGEILSIPPEYQDQIKILMIMNMLPPPAGGTQLSNTDFETYLHNIIAVLKYNHLMGTGVSSSSGVNSGVETVSVNTWVNKVFNNLMGENLPGGGSGTNPGIFQKIYALGNADLSNLKKVVSHSFDTMANAQKVGLDMINVVTTSLQSTYKSINSKMSGYRKLDMEEGIGAGVGAMAMGAIPIVGGNLASAAATIAQTAMQFQLVGQMASIGKELAWMPIALMVLTSMFTAGISFAVILPLTPFFLFWAGQVAWVLAVIEAMIAAPLVALSFIVPGGHQHFGHGVPAVKMLFAVVFRPVLMVIGLLVGMILTFVLISFSSQAFQVVSEQILSFAGGSTNFGAGVSSGSVVAQNVPLAQGIIAVVLLFAFCSFLMMAFTKCFSTIYLIPEKVMQWIGVAAEKAGAQELEKMSGGIGQSAQSGAQAGGSSTEKGIGAGQQETQGSGQASGAAAGGGGSVGGAIAGAKKGMKDEKRYQEANKPADESKGDVSN